MTERRSRTSQVEVAVDPLTAFTAFTEELDLWWVRGPINAYDSGRLVAMRCEPGVGGRIMEVYNADSGEGLELARITAWELGQISRLAELPGRRADRRALRRERHRHDRRTRGHDSGGRYGQGRHVVHRDHSCVVRCLDG